jgi:TrbB protein
MNATSNVVYSAVVQDNQLVAKKIIDGNPETLCIIDLSTKPSFYKDGGKVTWVDSHGYACVIDVATEDSSALLNKIEAARLPARAPIKAIARVIKVSLLIGAGFALGLALAPGLLGTDSVSSSLPSTVTAPPALPPKSAPSVAPAPASNEWALPASVELGKKLRLAADRKLFTIDYSAGHARTLYVFADPACPNCQRVEPLLEAASKEYNVVVFPVAVIGREKTIAAVTPVLCMAPDQRKAAWSALFDIGQDGLTLGQVPAKPGRSSGEASDQAACNIGPMVLGVNEQAYITYRIPGTPWVISDDGRHVSQALLSDPAKLEAFLNEKGPTDAAE